MTQQIAVVGLGRFGAAVAAELVRAGHDVLGIDTDLATVQRMSSVLTRVVQTDAVDEQAIADLGLADFDAAIIGITEDLETSILATLLLKRVGIPQLIAKARNELHGEILTRVGADRVIFPERDTGVRLAHSWSSMDITDSLDIVEGFTVSRVQVPEELVGSTIGEAMERSKDEVTLLLLARGARVTVYPSREEPLREGDVLVLAGQLDEMQRFFSATTPASVRA